MKCWLAVMLIASLGACANIQDEPSEGVGFPPLELIESNLQQTDVTVVLEIENMQRIETIGSYSSWGITAKVQKSLKGNLRAGDIVQYARTIEGDSLTLPIGSLHLVSFVRKGERLVIPDSGYHFPYTLHLQKQIESKFP